MRSATPLAEEPTTATPLAIWILRGSLALRAVGMGCGYLWHPLERESEIFGTLLFEWHFTEQFAKSIEDGSLWLFVSGAVAVLVVNACRRGRVERQEISAWRTGESLWLAYAVVWECIFAASITYRGGEPYSQLALASHALRIGTPATLWLWNRRPHWDTTHTNLLRLASCLTFVIHGYQAYSLSAAFTTLVIGTANRIGIEPPQVAVERLLQIIGIIDFLLASLLLIFHWRWVALYMALWGLLTALARMTGDGWMAYPETLERAVHWGGPLAIYVVWRSTKSKAGSKPLAIDVGRERLRER